MSRKIIWKGFFNGSSGYINACRKYPIALQMAGFDVGIVPLEPLKDPDDPLKKFVCKPEKDDLVILHQIPTVSPKEKGYFTVTEFNLPPTEWWRSLDDSEVILTQSEFCRSIFAKIPGVGKDKIHKVYFPIGDNMVPEGPTLFNFQGVEFLFGSTFEWVARKKPELMWKAFTEEFPYKDYPNIRFINKISVPFGMANWRMLFNRATQRDPRIFAMRDRIDDMGAFYRSLDCYCSPTAGEGWGATLSEAMCCGVPTIGSRHSGNLEFMNNKNSYLVETTKWNYIGQDKTNHLPMVYPWQKWKLPKIGSIRKQMRLVYETKMSGKTNKRALEAVKLREKLNLNQISIQLQNALTVEE